MTLSSHAKWLRQAAGEIRMEGHAGWGNTCESAADAIEAHLAQQPDLAAIREVIALLRTTSNMPASDKRYAAGLLTAALQPKVQP